METERTHVFQHLGAAPYRYVGMTKNVFVCGETSKPGGSCDHCMTGILYEYWLESADGKRFKVGSSCVEKSGDRGLRGAIKRDVATLEAQKRAARAASVRAELATTLADESVQQALGSRPHPNAHFASQGRTLLDYYTFMARRCGDAAKSKILRAIRASVWSEVDFGAE